MVDLVTEDLRTSGQDDPNALHFNDDGAECFANHVVDDLGVDELERLGYRIHDGWVPEKLLLETPLPVGPRSRAIDALMGCVDLRTQLSQWLHRDDGLPAPQADCVASALLDSGLFEEGLFADQPELSPEQQEARFEEVATVSDHCGIREPR